MSDVVVGQNPLPIGAQNEVTKMIGALSDRYEFQNGETAAYWHVCFILAKHLGEEKK